MCQSNVYATESGQQELILEDVARVQIEGSEVIIEPLFGEQITLCARIKDINLMGHRIVLEKI